jgi:hypothetical protein
LDLTLGLAISAEAVQFLLTEGSDRCGAALEHDEFDISRAGGVSAPSISEHVVSVVLGTQAIATAQSHTLHKVGVTWTEDVETEASLVLESLSDLGIRNVVPVPMLDAAEAFACSLARSHGTHKTTVLTIESDSAVATTVSRDRGTISDIASQIYCGRFMSDETLRSLAFSMFSHLTEEPDVLFVAGSGADFDRIAAQLAQVSQLPVKEPAEARMALARGAAIASMRPALAAATGLGAPTEQTTSPDDDEPTSDDGMLLPLLFVPRTARLASLDSPSKVATKPAFAEGSGSRRSVSSTQVLAAVLVGAVATFLVSMTLAVRERTATGVAAHKSSSHGAGQSAANGSTPPSAGAVAAGQPGTQAAQPLFIPGLSNFSLATPVAAPPGPQPPAAPARSAGPKAPVLPDVVATLTKVLTGPPTNLTAGGVPGGAQPAGTLWKGETGPDSPVAALYEPLLLATTDPGKVANPDLNLPALPNPAGGQ